MPVRNSIHAAWDIDGMTAEARRVTRLTTELLTGDLYTLCCLGICNATLGCSDSKFSYAKIATSHGPWSWAPTAGYAALRPWAMARWPGKPAAESRTKRGVRNQQHAHAHLA